MKSQRKYFTVGLLSFLLIFLIITPVGAVNWGDPLATDPSGDGYVLGEDMLAVDAQYTNPFVYFRFQLNEPIFDGIVYEVLVDYDKNISTGIIFLSSDLGADFHFLYRTFKSGSDINISISFDIPSISLWWVKYNSDGSAIDWSDIAILPYFEFVTFNNVSQAELAFGVDWSWVGSQMTGHAGNGSSIYLEFKAGSIATDWCPDRTGNITDYFEWNIYPDEGIPGFSSGLTFVSLLTLLAGIILLKRKQRLI